MGRAASASKVKELAPGGGGGTGSAPPPGDDTANRSAALTVLERGAVRATGVPGPDPLSVILKCGDAKAMDVVALGVNGDKPGDAGLAMFKKGGRRSVVAGAMLPAVPALVPPVPLVPVTAMSSLGELLPSYELATARRAAAMLLSSDQLVGSKSSGSCCKKITTRCAGTGVRCRSRSQWWVGRWSIKRRPAPEPWATKTPPATA